jgi:hypothetical protein
MIVLRDTVGKKDQRNQAANQKKSSEGSLAQGVIFYDDFATPVIKTWPPPTPPTTTF